jgi:dihydrofolate synthase
MAAATMTTTTPTPAPPPEKQPQQQHENDDNDLPPGQAWLRSLVDHERQGVPDGAGVAAGKGSFDPGPVRRLVAAMMVGGGGGGGGGHGQPPPPLPYRVAHIAGTKGKGSVAAMLSSALRESGLKVGTYTSPHLLNASERMVIGGGGGADSTTTTTTNTSTSTAAATRPVSPEESERLAQAARGAALGLPESDRRALSHFEVTTAMALRWFADQQADAAVVECGVGGETDATNVFGGVGQRGEEEEDGGGGGRGGSSSGSTTNSCLAAAVLTPVGRDHLAALGGSVAAAARAKAGIMKRGRPAIVAEQPHAEADAALREAAARVGAAPAWFLGGGGGPVVRVEPAGPVELLPPPLPSDKPARPTFKHLASQSVRVVVEEEEEGAECGGGESGNALRLLRDLEQLTRASPIRMRLVGAHQRSNAATAAAAAALMAALDNKQGEGVDARAVAQGLASAFLPGRFQVLGLPAAGPEAAAASAAARRRYLILDCAHTPESAAALAHTAREALATAAAAAAADAAGVGGGASAATTTTSPPPPPRPPPVVLVLAMADDKPHRDVAAQLLYRLRPRAVVFTSVPIAGGRARAASPTALAAQWQAAAMMPAPADAIVGDGERSSSRPPRCREFIQASLKSALQKARRELETALAVEEGEEGGGGGSSGVGAVVVAGSNHAVAATLRDLGVDDLVKQLE